jgi:hypothetical protein
MKVRRFISFGDFNAEEYCPHQFATGGCRSNTFGRLPVAAMEARGCVFEIICSGPAERTFDPDRM